MADKYYLRIRGKVLGPFEMKQLQSLRSRGKLGRSNDISMDRRDWVPASEVSELFPEESQSTTMGESHETESASPESVEAEPSPESQHQWHFTLNGQNDGPVPTMVLLQMISTGQLKPTDDVWREGMPNWEPANSIPELQSSIGEAVPERENVTSTSRSSSGFWGKFFVTTLILLVVGGGGFGAYSYYGNKGITEISEGETTTTVTTAIDANGYIVSLELGDAEAPIKDAVGMVVCAVASVKHDGTSLDEYIVKEQQIPGKLYRKEEKVEFYRENSLDKTRRVTKYSEIQPTESITHLVNVFAKLPSGTYENLPAGPFAWSRKTKLHDAGWTRFLELGTTGTCFMVTKDGYALTNRHVIEDAYKFHLAKNLIEEVRERFQYEDLVPTVYVFVNKELHKAKIVHVSDQFDLAILKLDRTQQAMFRVSNGREVPKSETVIAIGFPGAARRALTALEQGFKKVREEIEGKISQKFEEEEKEHSQNKGSVSRIAYKPGTGDVLQHDVEISGGYSGGPLIDVNGIVYGINTWSVTQATGEPGVYYAQRMKQFRDEIDKHVKSVKWVK